MHNLSTERVFHERTAIETQAAWKTRRGLVIWITSGFLVPTLYLAWHIFGWPEPIRISDETTRLTEPLTEDGYVHYIHCFRSQLKLNNDDDVNDPWLALLRTKKKHGCLHGFIRSVLNRQELQGSSIVNL